MSNRAPSHRLLAELPMDDNGTVALYDCGESKSGNFRNLVRLRRTGGLVWTAALPQHGVNDCFTAVTWDGPLLRANTFSGYAVWLDPESGEHVRSIFVK